MANAMPRHHRVPITVRVESFEGPLDLLLYLIQSHELHIGTVSIARVTDQYLVYITQLQELNFDVASDFLVMAATLLLWKSRAILPDEDKNDDDEISDETLLTKEDLVRQLLEHQRYLHAGDEIVSLPKLNVDFFNRPNLKPHIDKVWREMNMTDLSLSYQDMIVRSRKRKKILKKETVSISDKIMEFKIFLHIGEMKLFNDLFQKNSGRGEVVVTFLSSLELSRLKILALHQQEIYGPLYLELLKALNDFDISNAIGFNSPPAKTSTPEPQPKEMT